MVVKHYFLVILIVLSWRPSRHMDLNHCQTSLGMQSYGIKDEALSASSSLNETYLTAASARVRLEIGGGAWCPKNPVTAEGNEYLEVDLGGLHVVTLVETQGRFGNGQGQEFTEQYRLEFQRETGGRWFRYRNIKDNEIVTGNTNTYIPEMRDVKPAMIASKVRFVPVSKHPKIVCLRVELYGCPWTEGIVWYSIPQGEKRRPDLDFADFCYDGDTSLGGGSWSTGQMNYQLIGGLGQLTDGVEGPNNFRLDLGKTGRKGHEWVGWKNESFSSGNVEMVFAFESLRNFSSLSIFCNNMFSKDVRCFSRAIIIFSDSDFTVKAKNSRTVEFSYTRDDELEVARNVTIPLRGSLGNFVKVVLFFDSKWILISEVYFSSEPVKFQERPVTEEVPGNEEDEHPLHPTQPHIVSDSRLLPTTTTTTPNNNNIFVNNNNHNHVASNNNNASPANDEHVAKTEKQDNTSKTNDAFYVVSQGQRADLDLMIILISIFGLLLAVLITFFLFFCMFKGRKYCCHSGGQCFLGHGHHQRSHPSKAPSILMSSTGPSNSFFLPLSKSDTSSATFRQSYSFPAAVNGEDQNSGSTVVDPLVFSPFNISPSAEETIYRPSSSVIPYPLTFLDSLSGYGRSRISNCSNGGFSTTTTQPLLPPVYSANSTGFPYSPISCTSTCLTAPLMIGNSNSVTFPVAGPAEVNRDCLKYVATIGDGKFGQVYLCELQPSSSFNHYSTLSSISSWKAHINPTLVAVKVLLAHTDQTSRAKFENELHIMSKVKDTNIANLIGVCTCDLPNCLIIEYLRYGDLKKFLQKRCSPQNLLNRAASTPSPASNKSSALETPNAHKSDSLSTGCLLYMSSQIASGMKHLESLGLVHRDLACRNCLIGDNFHVKVSDMGTSHLIYEADYFSLPSSDLLLPVRWMAWEAVLVGKFTTKSDVWSFGMTLWEMMSFAHKAPLSGMTEEQVLENCEHFRYEDGLESLPEKPPGCPRELYDLMCHCWSKDKDGRPTFHEITMFLQQKTSGYNPQDDRHWLDDENLISE